MALRSTSGRPLSLPTNRLLSREWEHRLLVVALLGNDALVVAGSLLLAYVVRFASGLSIFEEGNNSGIFYRTLILMLMPVWLGIFYIYRLYDRRILFGGTEEYGRVFHACTMAIMVVVMGSFLVPNFVVARAWLLMTWVLTIAGCISARFLLRRWIYFQRRRGRFFDRTLVVGANPEGIAVAEQLMAAPTSGAFVLGFIDDYEPIGMQPVGNIPVVGSSHTFEVLVRELQIDQVVIANNALTRERLLGIYGALDTLGRVEVRLASGLFELLTTGVRVREEGCVPLVTLNKTRIVGIDALLKRALDVTGAGLGLLVLGPLLLVLALMIRLDSHGPAFHRRRVVGRYNVPFDAFKLRTMYSEREVRLSEAQYAQLQKHGKLLDDPRITRVGRWLRRFSLDELPQLWNVLRGEMSLIGPRMLTAPELRKFGRWQYNLRTVKPGLTGLWQISGRSDLSYEDRVRLDMYYIRNYSIWLDVQILMQTPLRVLSSAGAY